MSKKLLPYLVLILCGAALSATASWLPEFYPIRYGAAGTRDFVQYWAAFKLFVLGNNMYDPELVRAMERTSGYWGSEAVMMWNPPWVPLFFAPLLTGDFSSSTWLWRMLLPLVLCVAALLLHGRRLDLIPLVVSLLAYPVIDCWFSGQTGIILGLGVALVAYGLRVQATSAVIGGVLLLTLKPHVSVPLLVVLLGVERGRKSLVWSGLLLIGACVFVPGLGQALECWLVALREPPSPEIATPIYLWRGETFTSWLRGLLFDYFNYRADILMLLVPLVAWGSFLVWWFRRGRAEDLERQVFAAVCVGLAFAPYGWCSDYAALFPLMLFGVAKPFQRELLAFNLLMVCIALIAPAFVHAQAFLFALIPLLFLFSFGRREAPEPG